MALKAELKMTYYWENVFILQNRATIIFEFLTNWKAWREEFEKGKEIDNIWKQHVLISVEFFWGDVKHL